MKSATVYSALLFSFAAAAHAGQQFSFQDPIANGSYSNYMFETVNLTPSYDFTQASFKNVHTNDVMLTVDNFSSTGAYTGSTSTDAKYYLTNSGSNTNDVFGGVFTSGAYATGAGRVVFVNPSNESQVLFQVAFTKSALTYPGLTATQGLAFSGGLFNTNESGNAKASFSLADYFNNGTTTDHHTGTFYASIGTIGKIQATPEPASLCYLATGTLILLRRRRR